MKQESFLAAHASPTVVLLALPFIALQVANVPSLTLTSMGKAALILEKSATVRPSRTTRQEDLTSSPYEELTTFELRHHSAIGSTVNLLNITCPHPFAKW